MHPRRASPSTPSRCYMLLSHPLSYYRCLDNFQKLSISSSSLYIFGVLINQFVTKMIKIISLVFYVLYWQSNIGTVKYYSKYNYTKRIIHQWPMSPKVLIQQSSGIPRNQFTFFNDRVVSSLLPAPLEIPMAPQCRVTNGNVSGPEVPRVRTKSSYSRMSVERRLALWPDVKRFEEIRKFPCRSNRSISFVSLVYVI